MLKHTIITTTMLAAATSSVLSQRIAHFTMELQKPGKTVEAVTGATLDITGMFAPEVKPGAAGNALRLDGYSTYVHGDVTIVGSEKAQAMTVAMWIAPETYPIVKIDTPTDDKIALASTLDKAARNGWAFSLGNTGKYSFTCFSGGWEVTIDATDIIPCYEWSRLVAVVDGNAKKAALYRNGTLVGECRCMNTVNTQSSHITIGKSEENIYSGPFLINTFNGLIDDIEVYDRALTKTEIAAEKAENAADLSVSAARFADDLLRPRLHGMPAAGWTNECHGMYFADGHYHLFFQKNANGPFMTRLHWGHLSSENLFDWQEEKIAIVPGLPFDIKGCWSGCVFADETITGGRPNIIYTAVDYKKAAIAQAVPVDESLTHWEKSPPPIIQGRPDGLSDDFRDPYFFRNGSDAYIIVGSSKVGRDKRCIHCGRQSVRLPLLQERHITSLHHLQRRHRRTGGRLHQTAQAGQRPRYLRRHIPLHAAPTPAKR